MQAVEDLVQLFARHSQLAKVARAPDPDDHAAGLDIFLARDLQFKEVSPLFYLLDSRYRRLDALGERLLVQLLDQRFLDLGLKADLPGRFHLGGIGVNGLSLGEIDQRGNGSVASKSTNDNPASRASKAADMPERPRR